jgi:hypothetical protein
VKTVRVVLAVGFIVLSAVEVLHWVTGDARIIDTDFYAKLILAGYVFAWAMEYIEATATVHKALSDEIEALKERIEGIEERLDEIDRTTPDDLQ